jgi:exopolysaccharide biosynthesis predicted pyruvyltransferase EpsI
MRLLDLTHFNCIFSRFPALHGPRLGLVDGDGNVGDRLLQQATRQILQAFGLSWQTINILADPVESFRDRVDLLLLFAGGSMGGWRPARLLRQRALATGLPCILLPQTFLDSEAGNYQRIYVRETASLRYCSQAHLAPDLALGYDFHETQRPSQGTGLFLRKDLSSLRTAQQPYAEALDPAEICYAPEDYIDFASQYEHLVTDRLHLAITGLGLGRRVTLLPNGHHGNRAVWETWLKELGCAWAERPEEAGN